MDIHISQISCGVLELTYLEAPELSIREITLWCTRNDRWPAFFIWSNIDQNFHGHAETSGHKFAKFVIDNNLGSILKTHACRNPRTGNLICIWNWEVDREAVLRLYKKTKNVVNTGI